MNWISVEKELPRPKVRVLACTSIGEIIITTLEEHGKISQFKPYTKTVLYWQPLPSIPSDLKEQTICGAKHTVRERNPFRKEEKHD